MSVDPDLAVTDQPYAYAGDDPVNEADPSGWYSYSYYWDLGWLGQPGNVFDFFLAHPKMFPFSTGRCSTFYVNEKCEFRPEGTQDNLFVNSIDRSFREFEYDISSLEVTDNTLTLEVLKWCTAGVPGLFCIAGDPPHSTISFSILDIPAAAVSQKSCSGDVDVLEQHADAPNVELHNERNGTAPRGADVGESGEEPRQGPWWRSQQRCSIDRSWLVFVMKGLVDLVNPRPRQQVSPTRAEVR